MRRGVPDDRLKDRKVTFRLDNQRMEELEQIADKEGATVSFVVRHLVLRFLERSREVSFPSEGGF